MRRALLIVGVVLFAFAALAGDRLPAGILVHASTKSLSTAVANLDSLALACVKDTPAAQQYQPGMLTMLVGMLSPLPNGAWDAKGEIHVMLAIAGASDPVPAFVIKTPGLAAFKKAMADGGVKVQGDGKKMSAALPKLNGTWYFADIGGNRVAGAMSEAARDLLVQAVSAGWSPALDGNADLSINLDLKNLLAAYKPAYDAGVAEFKQQFENVEENMENTHESAKPLVAALSKVVLNMIDKLDGEVPAMNNFGIGLYFGGERLKLSFSLSGDAGGGVDALRAVYAGKGTPKYAFAKSLPEETSMVVGVSDLSVLPEGLVDFYVESLREIANVVIPDRAEEFANLPRAYYDLGLRECMSGMYVADGRPVTVFSFECDKPKELQALLPKSVELGQEYMANVLKMGGQEEAPSVAMQYEPEGGKVGNVPYRKIAFQFTRPGSDAAVTYDALFAIGRKTVTGVYGQVREEDLAYAIANYQKSSGDFINSEQAKAPLAAIDNRQIKFVEVRPLVALVSLFIGQAALAGIDPEALKSAAGDFSPSLDCLAIGAGATDKALTSEWVIPASVINNIVVNAKAITDMSAVLNPEKEGNAETYFDDEQGQAQEDANGENDEKYFDDPGHDGN